MNKYNITNCGKQFIVNADSKISAIKKLKDAKNKKITDAKPSKETVIKLANKYGGELTEERTDGSVVITFSGENSEDYFVPTFTRDLRNLGISFNEHTGGYSSDKNRILVFLKDSKIYDENQSKEDYSDDDDDEVDNKKITDAKFVIRSKVKEANPYTPSSGISKPGFIGNDGRSWVRFENSNIDIFNSFNEAKEWAMKFGWLNTSRFKPEIVEYTPSVNTLDSNICDGYYWNDIRQLCIKNNYYTDGTNAEYDNLFEQAKTGKWNAEQIAMDIYRHSDDKSDYNTILRQIKQLNSNIGDSEIKEITDVSTVYKDKESNNKLYVETDGTFFYVASDEDVDSAMFKNKDSAIDYLKKNRESLLKQLNPNAHSTEDSAVKDSKNRKLNDSWIGKNVSTQLGTGEVIDFKEILEKGKKKRIWSVKLDRSGDIVNTCWIKFNGFSYDSAITDRDSVDAQHMAEYGWTIESDLPRTVYWNAVEELALKLKSEEEYKREIVKLAKKKFEDAIVDIKREFEKIVANGRKKTSLFESWVGEQAANIMKKQLEKK